MEPPAAVSSSSSSFDKAPSTDELSASAPWYAGVSRYQWLVLAIASAGWVFDAFEGQLFNLTRQDLLRELLGPGGREKFWGDLFLAVFLVGGTVGGIGFGTLADRVGRKPILAATILVYAIFSALTFFATHLWQIAALRFLVALGVGGEWAVAAALVAEVFPPRARARAGGIFHSTSIIGTWIAALAGMLAASHWRWAYVFGIAPALLVFAVRAGVHEPERWRKAELEGRPMGSFRDLFGAAPWRKHAIFGLLLAAIGLGTFWSVVVAGQDLTRDLLIRTGMNAAEAGQRAKFAYGIVQTTGLGLGLLSFGPLAERIGRRGAFLMMHLCAFAIVPATCYLPHNYWQMLAILPAFGFFTGGMHAGYAIYFPELFPDHLRTTGAAVCFNGGRLIAAPLLWFSAELKSIPGLDLRSAVMMLSLLYLLGTVFLLFLPETKGRALPT
jgi:MFS family permease